MNRDWSTPEVLSLIRRNPQDVASEYFTGAAGQQLVAGSDDYYDVNVVKLSECNYQITCDAYREKMGEKVGRSSLRAELRLDPCIAVWTGGDTIISSNTTIYGDVYCNGNLTINGDSLVSVRAIKNSPALLVSGNIQIDVSSKLEIEGLAQVAGGISVANGAEIKILGTLFMVGSSGISGSGVINITTAPLIAAIQMPGGDPENWSPAGGAFFRSVRRIDY